MSQGKRTYLDSYDTKSKTRILEQPKKKKRSDSRVFSIPRPVVPIRLTRQRLILFQKHEEGDTTAFLNITVILPARSQKATIRRKSSHSTLNHFHACNQFSPPPCDSVATLRDFSWLHVLVLATQCGDNASNATRIEISYRLEQTLDVVELTFGEGGSIMLDSAFPLLLFYRCFRQLGPTLQSHMPTYGSASKIVFTVWIPLIRVRGERARGLLPEDPAYGPQSLRA